MPTLLESENLPLDLRPITLEGVASPSATWETPLPPLPAEKPWLQLPGDGRTVADFAQDLGGHLAPHGVYRCKEDTLAEDRAAKTSAALKAPRLVTFVDDFVQCTKLPPPAQDEEDKRVVTSMTAGHARLVLAADQFRNQLSEITHVNPVRMPVLSAANELRLLPTGVDASTRIFTTRGSTKYNLDLPIADARALLDGLLAEFPFVDAPTPRPCSSPPC